MKLLILPGWQQHHEHWQSMSQALTDRNIEHSVIDLPGFGSRPFDPTILTLKDVTDWVTEQLHSNYPDEQVVLCGHSYGGRVAAAVASEQPEKVAGLILIGSPNLYRPEFSTRLKKLAVRILHPVAKIMPESIKRKLRSDDYQAVRGQPLQKLFSKIITADQTETMKKITQPVELIWGENDTAAPIRIAHELTTIMQNVHLTTINGAGHNIHLEKDQLLAATIETYVQAIENN